MSSRCPPGPHYGDGQFLVMSAHHRPTASAMIKTLSLNFERKPAIAGTVVWSETGRLDHLVADAGAVTTLRTGAIVGVATDLLAAPDAGRLTLIGAGAQAPDQVRAVHAVRPLRQLTVVDTDPSAPGPLIRRWNPSWRTPNSVTATDAESAVGTPRSSAARPPRRSRCSPERAARQVHVNAIGAYRPTMRELPDELLASGTVVIDERDAILEESGEIIHALEAGAITEDALTELGAALTSAPSRRTAADRVQDRRRCRAGLGHRPRCWPASSSPDRASRPPPRAGIRACHVRGTVADHHPPPVGSVERRRSRRLPAEPRWLTYKALRINRRPS